MVADRDAPRRMARASWGAIGVGAVLGIMVGTMLNMLGAGTIAGMVDTTARATPGAWTLTMTSGLWLAASSAIGLFIGGWAAARLAPARDGTEASLHGAAVWAVNWLLVIGLLGSAASGGVVAALRGAGAVTAGAASAAVAGVAGGASQIDPQALVERYRSRLASRNDIANAPREEVTAETGQLLLARLRNGEWTQQERQRMETLIGNLAGIPQPEAAQRIEQTEREIQQAARQAEETARRAADTAAKGASSAALAGVVAMAAGLLAAILGALVGGPRSVGYRAAQRNPLES
jgi:hypothetical protein